MKIAENITNFRKFLWNGETKEVLGRNAKSWLEITVFYIIFYALLAGFWSFNLYVATSMLPEIKDGPKHISYLTHGGPGLHLEPRWNTVGSDKQRIYNMDQAKRHGEELKEYLDKHDTTEDDYVISGSCATDNVVNAWESNEPCFYFYYNRVTHWAPKLEDGEEATTIACSARKGYSKYFKQDEITSSPPKGFNLDLFPWKHGQEWDTRAPLVAVQLKFTEEFKNGVEARVVCKADARNIKLDNNKPNVGMVEFRVKAASKKKETESE